MIRVSIFEDNNHLRKSLATLIQSSDKMVLAGAFANCNQIDRDIRESQPDVVLMDIRMPGISGIDAVKKIKQTYPQIKVVVQTIFDNDDKIFAAICGGANGYILKNASHENYLQSIEDSYHGGAPMTPTVATKVLKMFQAQAAQEKSADFLLTNREREVLQELVKGKSYKMIAADLEISYPTVRFHIKNIYDKLYVQSMTEAVAKAIRHKIVDDTLTGTRK
jgi:DNA-binding NarL/FixJ family response regulator